MPNYTYELSDIPGVVIIHEEQVSYRMTADELRNAISDLKENQRAYLDRDLYDNSLALLMGALSFLERQP